MDFTVPMALVDYIPVVFFALASFILMNDLYGRMSKWGFALLASGVAFVAIAGALKATWKLLYASGVCDFASLNAMFFPVQSIGFLLAGAGMLTLVCKNSKNTALFAVVPPVFKGTFVFVSLMVAGLGLMDSVLCIIAAKMKKPWLILVFVLSFVCSLGMGYLASKDFAEAAMNWIAEGVNVIGQGSLLIGVYLLHKNGLSEGEKR